jgi:SPOR domain
MADDNNLRSYRTNDPHRRGPADEQNAVPASDPLAELARLIGQTDPLAEQSRPVPRIQPLPEHDWRRHIERPSYETMADPPAQHGAYSNPPSDYDYVERQTQQYAEPQPPLVEAPFAVEPRRDHYAADQYGHDDRHHLGGVELPEQDIYDDPPRRRRSNGLVTALVLIGCAVLGTVAAYGYRSYTSGATPGPAPVIVADRAPNKVVPASAPTETAPARSQERFPSGGERLVSREEAPVALQAPATTGTPRVVLPAPVQPGPSEAAPPAAAAPATTAASPPAAGAPPSSEPKRVRTVIIRSDGSDAGGRAGAAPVETRSIPNARTAAPPSRGQQATPPSRGGPISLDPQEQAQGSVAEPPRTQRALTPPAPRAEPAPPAPRVASAPSDGGGGGYVVQVSSQRSEADAQASFRSLQAKYSQLRNRQPIIRRADLGAKGTFYRAMVGPFASSSEANEFCGTLKAAGAQCLTQRN